MNTYYVVRTVGELGAGGEQQVWNHRRQTWEPRNESVWIGRIYRTERAAKRTAKAVGGRVSMNNQY